MKRCSLLVKLALLLCVAITIVFAPPSSLAYMAASSNTLHNSFRVVYLPPQDFSVPVQIQKSIINLGKDGIGPGGFEFQLLNVDTGEVTAATTAGDGRATINLPFTAEDVGKTYHYSLYEMNTGRKHVSYDEKIYNISITPVLNEVHELSAELVMDGTPVTEITAKFANKYYVPIPLPDTGDHSHPLLWLAMLVFSSAGLALNGRKRRISGG